MAEPIEMPFVLWTRVGPRKRVTWGAHWRHLANTTEPPCSAALQNGRIYRGAVWRVDSGIGTWNRVLDADPDRPMPKAILWEKTRPGMPDDTLQ